MHSINPHIRIHNHILTKIYRMFAAIAIYELDTHVFLHLAYGVQILS